ncbi:MAG: prolipoprotein diacylglyceryl transferase [Candidatus Bipolaricaulota bacterium]
MHPVFLRLGPLEIRYYGLMYVIALVLGFFLVRAEARRKGLVEEGLNIEAAVDLLLVAVPLGLVMARLYYVAFQWGWYQANPWEIPMLWRGGLAIHGGLLGGTLGLWIFCRWKRLPLWKTADTVVPAVSLGQALVRMGNFLNGDAYGIPTSLPWGLEFPLDSPAGQAYPGQALHPAMLYEMVGNLLIFALLWRLRKKPSQAGFLTAVYFISYSLIRFSNEFVRGDALMLGPIRGAQLASVLLIVGFGLWMWRRRLWKPRDEVTG